MRLRIVTVLLLLAAACSGAEEPTTGEAAPPASGPAPAVTEPASPAGEAAAETFTIVAGAAAGAQPLVTWSGAPDLEDLVADAAGALLIGGGDVAPEALDIISPEKYEREGHPHREWTWLRRHDPAARRLLPNLR